MTHERDQKSLLAVNLGLGINIGLAALKTFIGVTGHSPALLAEGINSTSDVAYYVVASVFVRMANKPADDEHPYGHRVAHGLIDHGHIFTKPEGLFFGPSRPYTVAYT